MLKSFQNSAFSIQNLLRYVRICSRQASCAENVALVARWRYHLTVSRMQVVKSQAGRQPNCVMALVTSSLRRNDSFLGRRI